MIKFLKQIFNLYINGSIHVAFAVLALVKVTSVSHDLCKFITYPMLVFFGTIIGYNFLKYWSVIIRNKFVLKNHFGIILITLFSFLGILFFWLKISSRIHFHFAIGLLMVSVYPFIRRLGFLKMFYVSAVVAYFTAFVSFNPVKFSIAYSLFEFLKRFFILSALMIPFEIDDSKLDFGKIKTLPHIIGIERSKIIGYLLLIVFVALDFFGHNFKLNIFLIDFLIAIIVGISIYFSSPNNSKYYTSFWVEAIPVLWWVLLNLN